LTFDFVSYTKRSDIISIQCKKISLLNTFFVLQKRVSLRQYIREFNKNRISVLFVVFLYISPTITYFLWNATKFCCIHVSSLV